MKNFDFNIVNGIEKSDFQIEIERLQIELLTPVNMIPYSNEGTEILGRYDTAVIPGAIENRNDIANTIRNNYPNLLLLKAKIFQNTETTTTIQATIAYNASGQITEVTI